MALSIDRGLHEPVLLGVAAIVAVNATIDFSFGSSWYDQHRIAQAVLLSTVGVALALWRTGVAAPVAPASLRFALVAVLLSGLVSSALSNRPEAALAEWATMSLILLLVATAPAMGERSCAVGGASIFLFPVGAYVVACVARYASALVVGAPISGDVILVGFSNPRFVGQMLVLCLPFAPLAVYAAQSRRLKFLVWLVATGGWTVLFASGSRTAWLAMLVAAAVLFFAAPSSAWLRQQLKWASAGAICFALLFVIVPRMYGAEAVVSADRLIYVESVSERFKLWRIAIEMTLTHPVFGAGPMHFAYDNNGSGAHPHNFWLQLGAEWGPATALFLGGLAVYLFAKTVHRVSMTRVADAPSALVRHTSLAALTVWGVGTQTDGFMVVPTSQLLSAAVLTFVVGSLACTPSTAPNRIAGRAALVRLEGASRRLIAATCSAVFLALPFTDFGSPSEREQRWREVNPTGVFWPRYWQMGWMGPKDDPAVLPTNAGQE